MQRYDERRRRNSKLESFLKRSLPSSLHEDVRWYESLIVRQGDQIGYKHMVVTGEQVYVTDTQPRTLTTLFHLNQISRVYMVHDLPEFLCSGLRERTTHTVVVLKPKSPKLKKKSSTSSILNSNEAIHEIEEEKEETESSTIEETPKIRPKKERKFGKAQLINRRQSNENFDIKINETKFDSDTSGLGSTSYNGNTGREWLQSTTQNRSLEFSSSNRHKFKRNSLPSPSLSINSEDPITKSVLKKSSHPQIRTPEAQRRALSPSLKELLNKVGVGRPNSSRPTRSVTPEPMMKSTLPRSQSALENYQRDSPLTLHLPTRSRSVLDKPIATHRSKFSHRRRSMNMLDVTDGSSNEQEVHIYTLSRSTVVFNLLQSFWISDLMNETMKFDINGCTISGSNHSRRFNSQRKDPRKIERMFNQLYKDITKAKSLEAQFAHIQELYQGISKYPQVKQIFWKDGEMLIYLRKLLTKYSNCDICSSDIDLEERQDQLELIIVILNTISACFSEIQLCPSKLKVIGIHGVLECLINEIVDLPKIPGNYNLTCIRWLTDFREFSSYSWENLPESELLKLFQEVITSSTNAIYNIIQGYQELSWDSMTIFSLDNYNKPNLFDNTYIENWLQYAIPQVLSIVVSNNSSNNYVIMDDSSDENNEKCAESIKRDDLLNGKEVVLFHRYLVIFKFLIENNEIAKKYCLQNYNEELRYYIRERIVDALLPQKIPLREHTLKLVSQFSNLLNYGEIRKL